MTDDRVAVSSTYLRLATLRFVLIVLALCAAATAQAQMTVYDDALQNSFQDFSYGAGSWNFNNTTPVHSGAKSIAFVGANFNALSFDHSAAGNISVASNPILRFWVHGGTAGNQPLRLFISLNNGGSQNAPLNQYIAGGAIAAGQWRQATIDLRVAPFSALAQFTRIDLQYDSAAAADPAQTLYVDDMTLGQPTGQTVPGIVIDRDVSVVGIKSDRFTWQDSSGRPRVAVLAHNDEPPDPDFGSRGGTLREFRYQLQNGQQRTATITDYRPFGNSNGTGFGYVVMHSAAGNCVGDDSPLGGYVAGTWQRIFEGTHHAIFRFTQNYPRNCSTNASGSHTIPVSYDWVFSTGRDNPLYAITLNVDQLSPAAAAGTLYDDSRAPYGELNIDGEGFQDIDGTAWGDRYKFTSTSAPVTLNSDWTWNTANSVPYIKEWIGGPLGAGPAYNRDATMGLVQTQTFVQQDAAGARGPNVQDVTPFWGKTSAQGNAGGGYKMPYQNDWPYQANADSLGTAPAPNGSSNNARLTWRTQYGFAGPTTYPINDGPGETVKTAPGYPKKSYSTYVVLGQHTTLPVEAQVAQVETIQSLTLSAITGSVVTTGPAGITRADNVTYAPPGYNHVYGALAFSAAGNALDANINVGAGTLKKPMIIVSNFTGATVQVKIGGVVVVADADYFASLRSSANELWLTLNRDLTGATNHLEVSVAGGAVPPLPVSVVAIATTSTQVNVTWTASAGASSYQVDRQGPGGAFAQIGTPAGNSFSDTTAVANTAYLYRVRAVNGAGASVSSTADLATTVIFADDPLGAGLVVKATHLAQLRTAINAVRALAGLGAAVVTDPAVAGTRIKAVHVTELRTALDAARNLLALSTGGYTDAALAGVTVKAVHFQELRTRVQ
jgi:hypothetical protein